MVATCEKVGEKRRTSFGLAFFEISGEGESSNLALSFSTMDECERIDVTPEKGSGARKVTSIAEDERNPARERRKEYKREQRIYHHDETTTATTVYLRFVFPPFRFPEKRCLGILVRIMRSDSEALAIRLGSR